jgi:N-methylhydantoinase B
VRLDSGGGAGWGDAYDRDPSAVLEDVIDGYVSLEGAARDYGVVIRDQSGEFVLDEAETTTHRTSSADDRKAQT